MKRIFYYLFLLFCISILTACATVQDIKKVSDSRHFTLEEDYIRYETRGLANVFWAEGLLKGKYTEFGEDDEGSYFIGEGNPVVILLGEKAESYKKTRAIEPGHLYYGSLVGGLWLPKQGSMEKPKIFYTAKQKDIDFTFGMVPFIAALLTEGSLQFLPYDSESDFISGIKIRDSE